MPRKPPAPRKPDFDPAAIRDISERVYAMRLGKDAAKMLAEVGTERFRERAGAYDDLTRTYLRAMRIPQVVFDVSSGAHCVSSSDAAPSADARENA